MKSGKGKYTFKNGDIYEGEWKQNNYHGKGTLLYHDGTYFKGLWKNDLKHGQGMLYLKDKVVKQVWKKDQKISEEFVSNRKK